MDYLLLQILLFLILAAVVGFFIGWLLRGFGFESRLIASENQWRARHHVLQGENNRLQSELDAIKKKNAELAITPVNKDNVLPLPFKSTEDTRSGNQDKNNVTGQNHPLDRFRDEQSQIQEGRTSAHNQDEITPDETTPSATPPVSLDQPEGQADDLKIISGIGPKIEVTLNNLGIYHFHQIADFTEDNINWVNEHLQFKGRIERENWVAQAKDLVNKSES